MTTFADLSHAQHARDAGVAAGRLLLEQRKDFLLRAIDEWAARSFRGSGPLAGIDPELSHNCNRWGLSRLRSEIKRALSRDTAPAGLAEILALSEAGFWQSIDRLRANAANDRGGATH